MQRTQDNERPILRRSRMWAWGVGIGALVSGCTVNTDILASQYDQTCVTATDCVGVEELTHNGTMCIYHCPTTAINVHAKAAFDEAKALATSRCRSSAMPGCVAPGTLACTAGKCGYLAEGADMTADGESADVRSGDAAGDVQ